MFAIDPPSIQGNRVKGCKRGAQAVATPHETQVTLPFAIGGKEGSWRAHP